MPSSLLGLGTRVKRSDSTRSDRSDISADSRTSSAGGGKKVSFNKAVRVKKYPRRPSTDCSSLQENSLLSNTESAAGGSQSHKDGEAVILPDQGTPEKKFWFKVYKNRKRGTGTTEDVLSELTTNENSAESDQPMPSTIYYHPILYSHTENNGGRRLSTIDEGNDPLIGNDVTDPHSSQLPPDPPQVRKNLVKTIVNKFNEEAVLRHGEDAPTTLGHDVTSDVPDAAPIRYETETSRGKSPTRAHKGNPVVNGVKVIFGFNSLKKKNQKSDSTEKHSDTVGRKQASSSIARSTKSRNQKVDVGNTKSSTLSRNATAHKASMSNKMDSRLSSQNNSSTKSRSPTRHSSPVSKNRVSSTAITKHNGTTSTDHADHHELENAVIDYSRPVKVWDSGNQLISDTSKFETSVNEAPGEESRTTVKERSQVWKHEMRKKYYEPSSPDMRSSLRGRRKAKSHSDLRHDDDVITSTKSRLHESSEKGVSTSELHKRTLRACSRSPSPAPKMRDIAVQCNRKRPGNKMTSLKSADEIHKMSHRSGYRVLPTKDGYVSAFSDVPSLLPDDELSTIKSTKSYSFDDLENIQEVSRKSEAIYSQINKSAKTKSRSSTIDKSTVEESVLNSSPKLTPSYAPHGGGTEYSEILHQSSSTMNKTNRKLAYQLKDEYGSADSKLEGDGFCGTRAGGPLSKSWFDEDDADFIKSEVEMIDRNGGGPLIRGELEETISLSDLSSEGSERSISNDATPAAVIREMDYKKQEISYENVPHQGLGRSRDASATGLWFRKAEEDYRREMAQSEVSYPAGSHVGTESINGSHLRNHSPDRSSHRRLGDSHVDNSTVPRIMVNGKDAEEEVLRMEFPTNGRRKKNGGSPSSVQSDPQGEMYIRGGLAAAYQARQKAALRRSNSSAVSSTTGNWRSGHRNRSSPSRHPPGSSAASGVSSSDSESNRRRRPVVMYIPGVSHHHRPADEDEDRTSGISVARSQSMLSSSKPKKYASTNGSRSANRKSSPHRDATEIFMEEDEAEDTVTSLKNDGATSGSKKSRGKDSAANGDLRRRHSMPKDTKFTWLKWKKKPPTKPSRQP